MHERGFLPAVTKYTLLCICIYIVSTDTVFAKEQNTECSNHGNKTVTWTGAVEFCHSLNSSLATIDKTTNMFPNDTCLYGNNQYWTGRYKVLSPWIEITGCFIEANITYVNKTTMDVRLCFLHCGYSTLFGLQNNTCMCLNAGPVTSFVTNASCVPSGINDYIVGLEGFIAVYRNGNPSRNVQRKQGDNINHNNTKCVYVSCEGTSWNYYLLQCNNSLDILCQNMETPHPALPWNNASGICYGMHSYLAGANITSKHCQNGHDPQAFWTYLRRYDVVVKNTFLGPRKGLNITSCEYTSMKQGVNILFRPCSERRGVACTKVTKACPCPDVRPQTTGTSIATTHTDYSTMSFGTTAVTGSITGHTTGHTTSDEDRGYTSDSSSTVTPSKEKSSKGTTLYIAVGCVGAVVMVILLTVLICCIVRRKKTKEDQGRKENLESSAINKTYSISQQPLKQENGYQVSTEKNQAYEMIDPEFNGAENEFKQNPNNKIGKMDKSKANYSEPWSDEIVLFKELNNAGSKFHGNNPGNNNNYKNQQSCEVKKDKQNRAVKEYGNSQCKKGDLGSNTKHGVVLDGNYHQIQINDNCGKDVTSGKTEDDYDKFERNKVHTQRPASNYDHFPLRQKSAKHGQSSGEGDDDLEDYDHLQTSPKRRELVDSTYDHTQAFAFEDTYDKFNQRNENPASDTYDHLPNDEGDGEDDYATAENGVDHNASGDYEISNEIPAVTIKDGGRDSYYTTVNLSEMEDQM